MNATTITHAHPALGFWGPVTSTLDWCEANYQFSHHIAEMCNTLSNTFTVGLAAAGISMAIQEKLPKKYVIAFLGVVVIGLGSFAFHATLLYGAQLADELPMVLTASHGAFILFDTTPVATRKARTAVLALFFGLLDILFVWTYLLYRNPVYHQVVFGTIMLAAVFRAKHLITLAVQVGRLPPHTKSVVQSLFWSGVVTFLLGFFVWNLDNIFCESITGWKTAVGTPLSFLAEGHSWWHVLTGSASYIMLLGITYLTLCVKEGPREYAIVSRFFVPRIKRLSKTKL